MPHFMSSMADGHRVNGKVFSRSRKTMGARKGSLKQFHFQGATALQKSPGRGNTPVGSEISRRDICPQNLHGSWSPNAERDLQFVGSYGSQSELHNGFFDQSPTKADAVKSVVGFQHAPAPTSLPMPPSSWTSTDEEEITVVCNDIPDENVGSMLSNQLKMLLKMQG